MAKKNKKQRSERSRSGVNGVSSVTPVIAKAAPNNAVTLQPVMASDKIKEVIEQIKPGDVFVIQFKKKQAEDLIYLRLFHHNGLATISDISLVVLLAVSVSGDWGSDRNRIFVVTAGERWNAETFSGRMAFPLEAITIKTPSRVAE